MNAGYSPSLAIGAMLDLPLTRRLGLLGDLHLAPLGKQEQSDDASAVQLERALAFGHARFLLQAEPVSAYCQSYNPAWSWFAGDANATAIFEMETGARYVFNGSWCSPGAETSWNGIWRVSGEKGTALWNGDDDPVLHAEEDIDGAARILG